MERAAYNIMILVADGAPSNILVKKFEADVTADFRQSDCFIHHHESCMTHDS